MKKEKQSEKLQDALYYLDDDMIEDVENLRGFVQENNFESKHQAFSMKKRVWKKWTALAASICVLFVGGWIYEAFIQPVDDFDKVPEGNQNGVIEDVTNEKDGGDFRKEDSISDGMDAPESAEESGEEDACAESLKKGVTIPKMNLSLKKPEEDVAVDMLGFFILNGRSYIQYEFQWDYKEKGADFVGDYVGHVTGLIDEWTEADGYVDGAGTYTGNVYQVKGVSPDFMLCMVWENGEVETFINHNDITLYKGSDLVDDWLDLRGNYNGIALEAIVDNKFTVEPLALTTEELEVFDRFLDAFAEGDYVYVKEKMEHPFGGDWDTPDMQEFYFVKENGVLLRFRTLGDGYVSFPWIDACIKIDQNIYDEVVEILQRHTK